MNRKLLYAALVLVNLLPFINGFTKGYSLRAPFVNLIAFAAGKDYDSELLLFVLLAVLLLVVLIAASNPPTALINPKKRVILHLSDGRMIAEENQQKVLQLQQLLQEAEKNQPPEAKRPLPDPGLDMGFI